MAKILKTTLISSYFTQTVQTIVRHLPMTMTLISICNQLNGLAGIAPFEKPIKMTIPVVIFNVMMTT